MKTLLLFGLSFLLSATCAAQLPVPTAVIVTRNEPVVGAIGRLEKSISEKLGRQLINQQTQLSRARALNRSIGDWGNAGPASVRLEASSLSADHTAEVRGLVGLDRRVGSGLSFRTATNRSLVLDAEDFADFSRIDRTAEGAIRALDKLSSEIRATNTEIAATYSAMITSDPNTNLASGRAGKPIPDSGMSQQKYEKLRGRMQALVIHLQGLQSQQRNSHALLQSQATLTGNKMARDAEVAAQVHKANQAEEIRAFSEMRFAELAWR